MDIIEDIINTLGLEGALYFRTDFSPPWSVTVPQHENAARFHLVVRGNCVLKTKGGAVITAGPGDLILVPNGGAHIIGDREVEDAPPLEEVFERTGYDGTGTLIVGEGDESASTQMVCGHYSFRGGASHPLLDALPDYIFTSAGNRIEYPLLDDILRLIARRIYVGGIGSTAAVKRMSEIVFIELLTTVLKRNDRLGELMAAFHDPQIGRAIELVHQNPGENWSVERLAREVGMSRSRFSEKFTKRIGISAMAYVANWRLQRALVLLKDQKLSVQEIAIEIGYKSSAAFTRAFSAKYNMSPKAYRKNGGG